MPKDKSSTSWKGRDGGEAESGGGARNATTSKIATATTTATTTAIAPTPTTTTTTNGRNWTVVENGDASRVSTAERAAVYPYDRYAHYALGYSGTPFFSSTSVSNTTNATRQAAEAAAHHHLTAALSLAHQHASGSGSPSAVTYLLASPSAAYALQHQAAALVNTGRATSHDHALAMLQKTCDSLPEDLQESAKADDVPNRKRKSEDAFKKDKLREPMVNGSPSTKKPFQSSWYRSARGGKKRSPPLSRPNPENVICIDSDDEEEEHEHAIQPASNFNNINNNDNSLEKLSCRPAANPPDPVVAEQPLHAQPPDDAKQSATSSPAKSSIAPPPPPDPAPTAPPNGATTNEREAYMKYLRDKRKAQVAIFFKTRTSAAPTTPPQTSESPPPSRPLLSPMKRINGTVAASSAEKNLSQKKLTVPEEHPQQLPNGQIAQASQPKPLPPPTQPSRTSTSQVQYYLEGPFVRGIILGKEDMFGSLDGGPEGAVHAATAKLILAVSSIQESCDKSTITLSLADLDTVAKAMVSYQRDMIQEAVHCSYIEMKDRHDKMFQNFRAQMDRQVRDLLARTHAKAAAAVAASSNGTREVTDHHDSAKQVQTSLVASPPIATTNNSNNTNHSNESKQVSQPVKPDPKPPITTDFLDEQWKLQDERQKLLDLEQRLKQSIAEHEQKQLEVQRHHRDLESLQTLKLTQERLHRETVLAKERGLLESKYRAEHENQLNLLRDKHAREMQQVASNQEALLKEATRKQTEEIAKLKQQLQEANDNSRQITQSVRKASTQAFRLWKNNPS